MLPLQDITHWLQELAPLHLAASWDNVGLLCGRSGSTITRVLTCLTLTHDVAVEAVQQGAELIITHHPLMFRGIQQLTDQTAEGRTLLTLLAHSIAVYSPHTAWDNAADGVNEQLARRLGLTQITPLQPATRGQAKLTVFLPESALEAVQTAAWQAGAGVMGEYTQCSFYQPGTGTFRGSAKSQPAVGQANQFEQASEIRLELLVPEKRLSEVLQQVRQAHPYEEPAIDVVPLAALRLDVGTGRQGRLPEPVPLSEFLAQVSNVLGVAQFEYVSSTETTLPQGVPQRVQHVGVGCGSAGELLDDALRQGCDTFVTGEARFHTAIAARDAQANLVLTGHYASERFAMEVLAERLQQAFPDLLVTASQVERNPLAVYRA